MLGGIRSLLRKKGTMRVFLRGDPLVDELTNPLESILQYDPVGFEREERSRIVIAEELVRVFERSAHFDQLTFQVSREPQRGALWLVGSTDLLNEAAARGRGRLEDWRERADHRA